MKRMRDVAGGPLRWVQPGTWTSAYELHAGDDKVATLAFRSAFGSLATGESADGSWTFKRIGFLSTRVTVRRSGGDTDLAVFHNNTWSGGGTLELPDGRKYRANINFWATQYELRTESDSPLITFRRVGGLFHLSSAVEVHDAAKALAELPWLVMLGWYLAVMLHRDVTVIAT